MIEIVVHNLDWIGVVCGILGWYIMPKTDDNKKYLVFIIGASSWIVWGVSDKTYSVVFLQSVFLFLYIRAYWLGEKNGSSRTE